MHKLLEPVGVAVRFASEGPVAAVDSSITSPGNGAADTSVASAGTMSSSGAGASADDCTAMFFGTGGTGGGTFASERNCNALGEMPAPKLRLVLFAGGVRAALEANNSAICLCIASICLATDCPGTT